MAKKQSTNSRKSTETSSAGPRGSFTSDTIGGAAGEIWHILNQQGPKSLAGLKQSVEASPDLVLAGVGWLAREGKLHFEMRGRTVHVSLSD